MRKVSVVAVIMAVVTALSGIAWADTTTYGGSGSGTADAITTYTVATLPTATTGKLAYVTDGANGTDCVTGNGSTKVLCVYNGSAWVTTSVTGEGTGDVLGPASHSASYIPKWSTANSKTLVEGVALSTDGTLAGNSDTAIATQKATKTYADTKQVASSVLTKYAGVDPSANVLSLLGSADYSTARTNLGLAIGTNVQAYDADLTTYAGITPSANTQTFLGAADYAAMRTQLGLVIGTNVQAYDADLTTYAGITPSADVQTLLGAANLAAIKGQLSVDDLVTLSGVADGVTHLGTFTGSTIPDSQTIKAAFQAIETAFEGLPGGHTQNTDTGTTRTTFLIDSGNTGARIKHNSGAIEARNAADDAYANFRAAAITGSSFSGNLTGNVTGNVSGTSGSTTGNAATVTIADAANDTTTWPLLGTSATGSLAPATDSSLSYNANTGALSATTFVGNVTGDVTGNVSGTSGSTTGNAATATALAAGSSTITVAGPTGARIVTIDDAAQELAARNRANTFTENNTFGNADTDTLTIRSLLVGGNSRAVQIAGSLATPTYATGTNELYVAGDIETAGTVYAAGFNGGTGSDGSRAITLGSNTTFSASGNQLYFLNNVLKVSENGTERDVVTPADSVTWTGTTHSFAGVTNFVLPTATPDAAGEIGINTTNHQLVLHAGGASADNAVQTIDFDSCANGQVMKTNGSGAWTCADDATAGSPTLNSVGNPTGDTTIAMDAGEEVNFDYTGNFTTGSQFKVEQKTGNPTGGVLFEVKAADTDVTAAKIGDGTNYTQFAQNGAVTLAGTATITAGGIVLGDSTPDASGEIGYASNAYTLFANSEDMVWTAGTNTWTYSSNTGANLVLGAPTVTTLNGHTFTPGSSTFTGTAGQTYTFPSTSATLAAIAAPVFTTSIEAPYIILGSAATAADAGTIRMPNAGSIMFEADAAGTDINALSVDSSEVVQIGASGASGVTITPTVTLSANPRIYDGDSHYLTLDVANLAADATLVLGGDTNTVSLTNGTASMSVGAGKAINFTGTFTDGRLCTYTSSGNVIACNTTASGTGDLKADGTVAMTAALIPNAANTIALGSTAAEWADIYLGDGAVIYGENDQTNTLTSSATGWTTGLDLTVGGNDLSIGAAGVKLTGSNGSLTILGLGDGADEDVKIDLNTTSNTIIVSSPASSATTVSLSALNLVTTGTISGLIPTVVENTSTTYNITQAQARAGTFFVNTNAATKTWVLPAAEAGMAVCIKQGQGIANIMRVDTDGTDYIVMSTGARTSAAGDYYGATASATNQICLVAFDATDWYVTSERGTWTEE